MTGIVLAFGASIAWGVSDFVAGLASRRAGALAVSLLTQFLGVALAAVWVVGSGDAVPGGRELLLAIGAGCGVVAGLGAFYKALTVGMMSIVAPLTALGVVVPVAAGVIGGDRPAAVQVAGVALGIAGVLLATRQPRGLGLEGRDGRAAVVWSLIAAAGSGLFMWLLAPASEESVPWALLVARGSAAPLLALVAVAAGRRIWPADAARGVGRLVLVVGALSFAASALYASSTRHGLLSLVSVVGSLYPAITVLLAWHWLGERLDRGRQAGVAAVLAGVVLIAAG